MRPAGLYAHIDKNGWFVAEVVKEESFSSDPRQLRRLYLLDAPAIEWNQKASPYYFVLPNSVERRWQVETLSEQEAYTLKLSEGYFDETTSIKLKTTESAQAEFTKQNSLFELAIKKGQMTDSSNVTFWDFEDNPQSLTFSEYQNLLLRYGMYCQYLYANFAP